VHDALGAYHPYHSSAVASYYGVVIDIPLLESRCHEHDKFMLTNDQAPFPV